MNAQLDALSKLDSQSEDYLGKAIVCLSGIDADACSSGKGLLGLLNRLIADIDTTVSNQLVKVYQDPKFRALESLWNGLFVIANLPVSLRRTGVRFLDISAAELTEDLGGTTEIERTRLYNLLANRELNTLGGKPLGMILVGHRVGIEPEHPSVEIDLGLARMLTELAASTLSPVIFSPADNFFGESDSRWLSDTDRMERLLSSSYYEKWRTFRQHWAARFAGMVMPSFLSRAPYMNHRSGVIFSQRDRDQTGLWCSAVFMFGATVMREFSRTSWFGFLRGVWKDRYQGAIVNLEPHIPGPATLTWPHPKYCFSKEVAEFYNRWGFIVAAQDTISRKVIFLENVSVQDKGKEERNRLGTRLETTLAACRISHYVKKRARQLLGELRTPAECESELTNWLSRYTTELDAGDEQLLCRYPLRSFSLSIQPQKDGRSMNCHLEIVPQWQLDEVGGDINVAIEYDR